MAVKVLNRVRNLTRMRTAGLAVSAFMGICCTSTPQDRNKGVRYLFPTETKVSGTFFRPTSVIGCYRPHKKRYLEPFLG